jgi:hypothetical protein
VVRRNTFSSMLRLLIETCPILRRVVIAQPRLR